jgi:hypothetical protein
VLLQNLGNVPTRYELFADDPAGALKFRLLLNGMTLPQEPVYNATARSESSTQAAPPSRPVQLRESGRVLANLAYTIGSILPGDLGNGLKGWAMKGFEADRAVQNVEYAGQQAQALGSVTPSVTPVATAAPVIKITPGAWYTAFIQPGSAADLNLVVKPSQPLQKQHYAFRLSSRAIDPAENQAQTANGNLLVEGASLTKYYVTFFVIAGITLIVVVAIGVLLANAGG